MFPGITISLPSGISNVQLHFNPNKILSVNIFVNYVSKYTQIFQSEPLGFYGTLCVRT